MFSNVSRSCGGKNSESDKNMTRDYSTERMSLFAGLLCAAAIFTATLFVKKGASFVFATSLVIFCVIFILSYVIFTLVSQTMKKQPAGKQRYTGDASSYAGYEFTPKVKAAHVLPPVKAAKGAAKKQRDLLLYIPQEFIDGSAGEKINDAEKSKTGRNIETLLQEASAGAITDEHPLKDKLDFLLKADPKNLANIIKGEWMSHGE